MAETAQQYTARLFSYVGEQDPLELMASAPARLKALVAAATPAQLQYSPSPDRWSTRVILAHLADAEIVGAWRFRSILAQDAVAVQGYDQNEWATAFRYEKVEPSESLAIYEAVRRATVRALKVVDVSRRAHAGLHSERGRESIEHMVRLYAGHDLNHFGQIERLLAEARDMGAAMPGGTKKTPVSTT